MKKAARKAAFLLGMNMCGLPLADEMESVW